MSVESGPARSNQAIFMAALEIADAAEQRAFLEVACGDDVERRRGIERLLAVGDPAADSPLDRVLQQLSPAHGEHDPEQSQADDADASIEFDISNHPTIDRYKLLEQIGEGGMGSVYMAQQYEPIRRRVALKLIKVGLDSREVISRFQTERQALAMMDHPNIARVLDAGTTPDGRPYFAMELVRGLSITKYCDQNCLSINDRLRLFIDVCRAVQHAHQKGIIHRDLKPSNVMVTLHDGVPVVKVIDFGVAKALNQELTERTLFTQFSQMIGTPLYMSPEQAEMTSQDIDTRSDVYSLGVLLYELLTGTTPFDKKTLSKAGFDGMRRIIREQEPARPSHKVSTLEAQLLSTVSSRRNIDARQLALSMRRELDWIAMKALEKDRNRRYESASALAQDVECYLNDDPVQACPPSAVYRLRKIARRYRGLVTTACLLALIMLIATGLLWSERGRTFTALAGERDQRQIAEDQQKLAQAQEAIARRNESEALNQRNQALQSQYRAEIVSGQADWERGYLQRLNGKLMGHLPLHGQPDRRAWEWRYLWSLCHPEVRTLHSANNMSYAAWSPDGQYVAASGDIWRAGTGEMVRRLSMSSILRSRSAWSPDSRMFAWGMASDDSGIYVWDRETDEVREFRGHVESVWTAAWSPDSEQLASGGIDGKILIWEVATGEVARTLETGGTIGSVAWSPDGELLAACISTRHLGVWSSTDGEPVVRIRSIWGASSPRLSWHPDGEQLAVCTSQAWCLIRRSDWTTTRRQDHEHRRGKDVAWSPDGKRLAITDGETVGLWDPSNEQPERTLRGHSGPITEVDWSPDGQQIVSSDSAGAVKIWAIHTPFESPGFSIGGPVRSLTWQDDNQTLAVEHQSDRAISFWNALDGQRLSIDPAKDESQQWWSPDRRLVACYGDDQTAEIRVMDAQRGDVHAVWRGPAREKVANFAWSPNGKMLAIANYSEKENASVDPNEAKSVTMWDVAREQSVSNWLHRGIAVWNKNIQIVWSPEATHVAITARGETGDNGSRVWCGHVYVVNVANGTTVLKHLMPHRGDVSAVAWRPDGRAFVAGSTDGLIQAVDVGSGETIFETRLYSTVVNSLAWSPDGRRIVSAADDGSIKLLAADDGGDLLIFPLDDKATHVAWNPAGNRLAAATSSGQIHVWDAARADALFEQGERRGELAWAYYRARPQELAAEREARLREMLRVAPDTLEFWQARGEVRATLGDFAGANEEFAKAISPGIRRSFDAARAYGLALLGAGRANAYREHCVSMMSEFSDTQVPSSGGYVAWLCALAPNHAIDTETLARLARENVARNASDGLGLAMLQLGAALYRHGLYQESADQLTDLVERLKKSSDPTQRSVQADALYFLAMARHHLGHRFQARRQLNEATKVARQIPSPSWQTTVQHQVLEREARTLLGM